jgi:hypothetical protein
MQMEQLKEMLNGANLNKETLARAMREIKKGNIDMEQVQKKMTEMMSANEEKDPRKRLQMKIANKQSMRSIKRPEGKEAKERPEGKEVKASSGATAEAVSSVESKQETALKNKAKKLRELQKKYGTITDERYRESLAASDNGALTESERAHHRNILDLYAKQNKFKQQIDFADMDDI